VGETIASRLVELGHVVRMAREPRTTTRRRVGREGRQARGHGTFADAAGFAEVVFTCVNGEVALEALRARGCRELRGQVLVDVTNRLEFTKGMPPLSLARDGDSTAEQIQREFPQARVVKSLNTMNCRIMVDPRSFRAITTFS